MHHPSRVASLVLLVVAVLPAAGCKLRISSHPDAGVDAAAGDAAQPDAALPDAAPGPDAVATDAAQADAAQPDAAPTPDAGPDGGVIAHDCNPTTAQDCSPGTGSGVDADCPTDPSCHLAEVQAAVNGVIAAHPDWFFFDDTIPCYVIICPVGDFLDAVVVGIQNQGLCVMRDPNAPDEEVTVKWDNAFSENFDIVSSAGCARSGAAIYTGCNDPAWW